MHVASGLQVKCTLNTLSSMYMYVPVLDQRLIKNVHVCLLMKYVSTVYKYKYSMCISTVYLLKDQRSIIYAGMTEVAFVWHFWQKYFPV